MRLYFCRSLPPTYSIAILLDARAKFALHALKVMNSLRQIVVDNVLVESVRPTHVLHETGVKFFRVSIYDPMGVLPEELHLASVRI